jgi:hypothetical protein
VTPVAPAVTPARPDVYTGPVRRMPMPVAGQPPPVAGAAPQPPQAPREPRAVITPAIPRQGWTAAPPRPLVQPPAAPGGARLRAERSPSIVETPRGAPRQVQPQQQQPRRMAPM